MKKKNLVLSTIGLIAVIAFVVGGLLVVRAIIGTTPTKEVTHTLSVPHSAVPTVTPTPTPTPTVYTGPVALTVASNATMSWSSTLEPADFVHVFQLVDPAKGFYPEGTPNTTTYYVAHSYAKGYGAPGNAWEKLVVGDVVAFPDGFYEVDYTGTPAKGDLAAEPIWTNFDGWRVLITCDSRGAGYPATNNFVIRLHKLSGLQ